MEEGTPEWGQQVYVLSLYRPLNFAVNQELPLKKKKFTKNNTTETEKLTHLTKVTELSHSRPRLARLECRGLMLQALCTTNYATTHPIIRKSQEILKWASMVS